MRFIAILYLLAYPLLGETGVVPQPSTNKRLAMYRIFYLPFDVTFQPGRDLDSILPYRGKRLLEAHELVSIDSQLGAFRAALKKNSLLETSEVESGQSKRLAVGLYSHRVAFNRSAVEGMSKAERIETAKALSKKNKEVSETFFQLRLLKSFVDPSEEELLNFFIVSASWCESSREYRLVLENYLKRFQNKEVILHSVLVSDDKKQIFQSPLIKELFPHPKEYSHDTIPRFIAVEWKNGQPHIWEEGDALKELYDRHLAARRGFLEHANGVK